MCISLTNKGLNTINMHDATMKIISKFIFGLKLCMFRTFSLPILKSLALYTQQQVYVIQVLLTACQRDQDCVLVQCQTPDDEQRNCSKHVESQSKNKFEILVHLVGLIIRIYHDARSSECKTKSYFTMSRLFQSSSSSQYGSTTLSAELNRERPT